MLLIWLTAIVAAAIVLVLVGFLIATGIALTQTRREVAGIADALERVATETAPLDDKIARVDAAMGQLAERTSGLGPAVTAAFER